MSPFPAGCRERESGPPPREEHPMTTQRSFKRLVRSRMEKTGESYTAARAQLLDGDEPQRTRSPPPTTRSASAPAAAGRSGSTCSTTGARPRGRTARSRAGSRPAGHPPAGLERPGGGRLVRARGRRSRPANTPTGSCLGVEDRGGAGRAPLRRVRRPGAAGALAARGRPARADGDRAAPARFDWGANGTRVHVTFAAKGNAKSTAAVSHARLADAAEAERMKTLWRERVAGLKEVLEA